ncbi:hypothetical protein PY32053_03277 [Paracoccus yeei]|uniref:Sulfatase-modifying factor enzyme-like domain-containing protein n=1 Tax=Paracoccus yeei TaxID=147645 RepID=A0A386UQD7_9RHOB|nr:SUMF1/EgtB/PvdO family nonheme iron enzyme [Paracoccus yeei]AYF02851.1 hypothetical protein PY32053_03277 [Paracoccus yeei]
MRLSLAIPLLLSALATAAGAQPPSKWEDFDWNPQPLAEDVILPMPCDGAMAFRRVDTPTAPNWLADTGLQMGNSDVSGQEHSESLLPDNITGGLTKTGPDSRYYLLGKYEVSRRQYQAVMSDSCPRGDDEAALPAEGMSWLDAQTFAARYTEWLYTHARNALAEAAGEGSFLRLPTEEEWEFAARGGLAVNDGALRKKLFPMDGPLEDYVWFAGFKSCDGKVQSIGVLKQNPLGFFDILGNVQELTAGLYRLRTREQLHGQAGGLVARGGSCLTAEARMRSSDRDEIAPYDDKTGAPRGKVFTGLRLAFGAPILSSAERISTINEDWRVSGEMRLPLEPGQDPVEALGIIAEAEPDARVRDALLNARDLFQREMTQRNAVEGRSAASVAQGGMLAVRSYLLALQDLANSRELLASNPDDRDFRDYVARAEERRQLTENVLLAGIVHAAEDFSDQTYSAAAHVVAQENEARLAGMRARTRVSTMRMHDLFGQFVGTYRKHPDTDPQEFLNQIEALRVELSQLQD